MLFHMKQKKDEGEVDLEIHDKPAKKSKGGKGKINVAKETVQDAEPSDATTPQMPAQTSITPELLMSLISQLQPQPLQQSAPTLTSTPMPMPAPASTSTAPPASTSTSMPAPRNKSRQNSGCQQKNQGKSFRDH